MLPPQLNKKLNNVIKASIICDIILFVGFTIHASYTQDYGVTMMLMWVLPIAVITITAQLYTTIQARKAKKS